jgi:hypothetical protein
LHWSAGYEAARDADISHPSHVLEPYEIENTQYNSGSPMVGELHGDPLGELQGNSLGGEAPFPQDKRPPV